MTVAHVKVPTFLPFSETFIYDQLRTLPEFEHRVLTVRTEHPERFGGYETHALERLGKHRAAIEIGLRRAIGYCPFFRAAVRGASLLHAHFGLSGYFALGLARAARLPLLTTFYGRDAIVYPRLRGWAGRYRRLFESGEQFVTTSEFLRSELLRAGCPAEKLEVIYLGVDTGRFRPAAAAEPPRVTFVGRLWEGKGVFPLLRAFRGAVGRGSSAELHYVGDGPDRPRLERLARELGLERRVRFHGAQAPDTVAGLMAGSAVVALPSLRMPDGWTEAFGMALVEAQACGVPVIGSRTGGIPETMAEGETGLLAEPGDEPALTRCLEELLVEPARRKRMGEAGRRRVVARFCPVRQAAARRRLYGSLAGTVS